MPSRINRKKRSNQRAEYLQKQDNIKTRLKPERATRPIPKRRRPLYATATRPIPKRRLLYATATTQNEILNLSNLLKGSDIKRTSRRTAPLKGRNSAAIKASERNRYWNDPAVRLAKRAARGSVIAGVTELHYHPKVCHGMLYWAIPLFNRTPLQMSIIANVYPRDNL